MFSLASSIKADRGYLLVEDEEDTADLISEHAKVTGLTIIGRVATIPEALQSIEEVSIKGILIHTRHADTNEARTLRLLRHRGVEVVFFTGFDDWFEDDIEEYSAASDHPSQGWYSSAFAN
jgi:DNA-binding response OmpR family regulator